MAGGEGGASGSSYETNDGGFGGGVSRGNSHCGSSLRNHGAGTQTGSSPGPAGSGPAGVAGTFGKGATSIYNNGCDSGGGGWYGGGSTQLVGVGVEVRDGFLQKQATILGSLEIHRMHLNSSLNRITI